MFLKLLQLPLEAQVGVGTGPPRTNGVQGIFPAKVSDSHDVCDHQGHTPGDPSQAAGQRQPHVSRAVWKLRIHLHQSKGPYFKEPVCL